MKPTERAILWTIIVVLLVALVRTREDAAAPDSPGGPPASASVLAKPGLGRAGSQATTPPAHARQAGPGADDDDMELFRRILKGGKDRPTLKTEAIEAYVRVNGENAQSLLAAFEASWDKDWLKKAAELHPDDPLVMFAVLNHNVFPERRREWMEKFKAAEPDNALADYMFAAEHMKQGDIRKALEDVAAGVGKPGFEDHAMDSIQTSEEMYLMAGYDTAEAKAAAASQQLLPHLKQFKGVGQELARLHKHYARAGDMEAAQRVVELGLEMGRHMSVGEGGDFILHQLVGAATEQLVLDALDPGADNSFLGRPLGEMKQELQEQKDTIRAHSRQVDFPNMSRTDLIAFFDRMKIYGEYETVKWFLNRDPTAAQTP